MFHYQYVLMDCFLLLLYFFCSLNDRRFFLSFLQHVPSRMTFDNNFNMTFNMLS